ncbi:MAG: hypothetical protein J0M02_01370 [Planctomycetes bacterium]|nr:hypothetical protein [Planctomycetota bacterium]
MLITMDPAALIEKNTRRNRVRRGRRGDGILVGIGDADPNIDYACPVCGDALRQKRSCLDKPFFAHIGGDGTCADDAVRHAAAVRVLGDLVHHAVAGRLTLRFAGRCMAGRHGVDQCLDVRSGDVIRRDEHGLAIYRDGAAMAVLVVHQAHEQAVHADALARYAVDADEVLGWDADAALEACGNGGNATLVLVATLMSGGVSCPTCAREREAEQRKADKAAATEARERTERCQAFADALMRSGGLFETGFCAAHPDVRRTIDISGRYDGMEVDAVLDGERWDVALTRKRRLALGILLVRPDGMTNPGDLGHRCRDPGNAHFVAVPEDAEVQPATGAWPTNTWHLRSEGRCPRCDDLPRLVKQIDAEEAAFATRFEVGKREIRPADIRTGFRAVVDERLPWYPAVIETDVDAATAAAVERLLAAAARVWPPSTAEARRALETKALTGDVNRMCAGYARKHLVVGMPPKSAAEIHRAIHYLLDRGDGMSRADQAAIEVHIASSIERLVKMAWALWSGHENRAKAGRQMRQDEQDMGLRRRWGRRRSGW